MQTAGDVIWAHAAAVRAKQLEKDAVGGGSPARACCWKTCECCNQGGFYPRGRASGEGDGQLPKYCHKEYSRPPGGPLQEF